MNDHDFGIAIGLEHLLNSVQFREPIPRRMSERTLAQKTEAAFTLVRWAMQVHRESTKMKIPPHTWPVAHGEVFAALVVLCMDGGSALFFEPSVTWERMRPRQVAAWAWDMVRWGDTGPDGFNPDSPTARKAMAQQAADLAYSVVPDDVIAHHANLARQGRT